MEPRPTVKLSEEDGNVFSIIARVSKTLKRAGKKNQAEDFVSRAQQCPSYDAVLLLVGEYVEIE